MCLGDDKAGDQYWNYSEIGAQYLNRPSSRILTFYILFIIIRLPALMEIFYLPLEFLLLSDKFVAGNLKLCNHFFGCGLYRSFLFLLTNEWLDIILYGEGW